MDQHGQAHRCLSWPHLHCCSHQQFAFPMFSVSSTPWSPSRAAVDISDHKDQNGSHRLQSRPICPQPSHVLSILVTSPVSSHPPHLLSIFQDCFASFFAAFLSFFQTKTETEREHLICTLRNLSRTQDWGLHLIKCGLLIEVVQWL